MADRTTRTTPAPVVSAREALEFLSRAGFVLADSLDYEQTLAPRRRPRRPADRRLVRRLHRRRGRHGARDHQPATRTPTLEAHARRDPPAAPRRARAARRRCEVLRSGRSILATDVTGTDAPDLSESQRASYRAARPALVPIVPLRARGRVHRRADAAVDPRGPSLPRAGPRLRGDARRALRAGDRQRAPLRRRRALRSACSTRCSRPPRSGSRSSTPTCATCASTRPSPP